MAETKADLVLLRSVDIRSEAPAVLVVDDDALLRWHAADLLADNGFCVLEADGAESALRILEGRPDVRLLFTDIQMPGELDGVALAQKVHERWPRVLLLVTSGNVRVAERDIPDDGRFMAKPYGEREIVDRVEKMIAEGHQDVRER